VLLIALCPTSVLGNALDRDGVISARLSPQGTHVAVITRRGQQDKLRVVSLSRQETVASVERVAPERIFSAEWVDDERLVIETAADESYIVDPSPDGVVEILTLDDNTISNPIDSVNNSRSRGAMSRQRLAVVDSLPSLAGIMVLQGRAEGQIWVVDARSGSSNQIVNRDLEVDNVVTAPNAAYFVVSGTDEDGGKRVQSYRRSTDGPWINLDPTLHPLKVTADGTLYAYRPNAGGVLGFVSVDIQTGQTTSLFQDEVHDATEVLFDVDRHPVAVQFVPDFPSWTYVGDNPGIIGLHKSMRAALPEADIVFVDIALNHSQIVAKARFDFRSDLYFVIDTKEGHIERLLQEQSSLYLVGGQLPESNAMQPIGFQNRSGQNRFGYLSGPAETGQSDRPLAILLTRGDGSRRWSWGFRPEAIFLNVLGFNVLMVNRQGSGGYGDALRVQDPILAANDIEDAIIWATENELGRSDQVCILVEGAAAEIAFRVAMGATSVHCVVSFSGDMDGITQIVAEARTEGKSLRNLSVLQIYGDNVDQGYVETLASVREVLESQGALVETFKVAGEQLQLTQQPTFIEGLARATTFLSNRSETDPDSLTLPLTYDQAAFYDEVIAEFESRLEPGNPPDAAVEWLLNQSNKMADILSPPQFDIYTLLVDNLRTVDPSRPNRYKYVVGPWRSPVPTRPSFNPSRQDSNRQPPGQGPN
jgi:dipeptidyl aminopeptidase/acylaminoacyl peptidase